MSPFNKEKVNGNGGVATLESPESSQASREAALFKAKEDYALALEHLAQLESHLEAERPQLDAVQYARLADDVHWLNLRCEDLRLVLVSAQSAFDAYNAANYSRQLLLEKKSELEDARVSIATCSAKLKEIERVASELPLRRMRAAGAHNGLLQRFAQLESEILRMEKSNVS